MAFEIPAVDKKKKTRKTLCDAAQHSEDKDRNPVKPQNLLLQFVSSCP